MLPDEELDRTWLVQFRAKSTTEWFSLFEVKKSTREGAGYGLFAARPYSWGDTLGVFYGVISVKTPHQKRSIYAMEVVWPPEGELQQRLIVDPTSGPTSNKRDYQPTYFGLHMANDPEWNNKQPSNVATSKRRSRTRDSPTSNFIIDVSLVGIATRDIAVGEELFLNYDGDAY
jgi:hypothetical protein